MATYSVSTTSAASSSTTSFSRKYGGTPSKGVSLARKRRAAAAAKSSKVSLENVLGLTCHSVNSFGGSDTWVAYPAGCVAVLQDPRKKNKKLHLINKKPISCLCLSSDGEYLATGEYGHEPCARVWDLKEIDPTPCCQLRGHSFGVKCMVFTFGHKYLITFGYRYDRQVIFWNWKTGTQLLYGKYGQPVNAIAISEDHSSRAGLNYFVTAHPRRVQYWYYDPPPATTHGNKKKGPVVLKARSAILGDMQDNNFVAIVCGSGPIASNTYVLSKSGKLLLFDTFRLVDKFTEIKASPAHSLVLSDSYLFCGCSEGVIRLFDPYTLDYVITLPYPHPLGLDISVPVVTGDPDTLHYPDAIAMVISNNKHLSVVYNDHSFYVWDISNVKQVGKSRSSLFHSACVWDICTYPFLDDDSKQLLPESSFVTCSSDNTVRFWCLDPNSDQWNIRNIYSKELIRVVYNDSVDINSLKDISPLPGDASAVADSSRGVRSIMVNNNGQHLATGDREGNLRIYDLQFMDKIYEEVAHDAEILSLSFSKEVDDIQFLATASRDRMVHVFTSTEDGFQPVQSLPDHSAAVTAVGFTTSDDGLQLLSSGADKSIIFHLMERNEDDVPVFRRSNHIANKASIYDMAIDSFEKFFLTAGQDKFIRMFGVATGKKHTVIKVPTSDDGAIIRVTLDPSGLYAAASVADKSVLLFDIYTGECVAKVSGHSEVVTQLKFSRDCKHLYTVSGDSCIFVWQLWPELTKAMHERLAEITQTSIPRFPTSQQGQGSTTDIDGSESEASKHEGMDNVLTEQDVMMMGSEQPDFDFRLSMLPTWARKAAMSRPSMAQEASKGLQRVHSAESGIRMAEGKWAERVVESELTFASDARHGAFDDEMPVRERKKSDSAPMIVDLTENDTPEGGSPEVGPLDTSPKSSGDSDLEGEVLYHPSSSHHLDVDPSIFTVTTPTKPPARLEDVDEEEESVTPNISPPLAHRPTDFLEANFQSLEKAEEEEEVAKTLEPIPSRLSISSKFLRKHSRLQLYADSVSSSSPILVGSEGVLTPIGTGSVGSPFIPSPPDEVGTRMLFPVEEKLLAPELPAAGFPAIEVQGIGQRSASSPAEDGAIPEIRVQDTGSVPKGSAPVAPSSSLDRDSENATSERASKANFELEVSQTKRRLMDLGYDVGPPKEAAEEVVIEEEEEEEEPRSKEMGPQVVSTQQVTTPTKPAKGQGIRKAKEIEGESKKIEHGGSRTLSAKAASALSGLEANFRTLTMLNAEAVKYDDTNAMAAISKGLIAHKVKVVSWSNRNRKSMRKRGKGEKGSLASPLASPTVGDSSGQDSQSSIILTKDAEDTLPSAQSSILGPKEIEEANALVDQLKRLLSQ